MILLDTQARNQIGFFDTADHVFIKVAALRRFLARDLVLHSLVVLAFGLVGLLGGSTKPSARKPPEKGARRLDKDFRLPHTEIKMQLSVNKSQPETLLASLVDLRRGDAAILDRIDLPGDDARRLMELGFLPGARWLRARARRAAIRGCSRWMVRRFALRRETARRLKVRAKQKQPRDSR